MSVMFDDSSIAGNKTTKRWIEPQPTGTLAEKYDKASCKPQFNLSQLEKWSVAESSVFMCVHAYFNISPV
jgi:hypothetical protein